MANYISDAISLRLFFIVVVALLSGLFFYVTTPAGTSKKNAPEPYGGVAILTTSN